MGTHDCKTFQLTVRNCFSDFSTHTGRLDVCDCSIFNHRYQFIMCFSKRTCTDCDIFDSHRMDFSHDHINNIVTLTEMMMETKCHSVFNPTFHKYFMNVFYKLASFRVNHTFCLRSMFLINMSIKMPVQWVSSHRHRMQYRSSYRLL